MEESGDQYNRLSMSPDIKKVIKDYQLNRDDLMRLLKRTFNLGRTTQDLLRGQHQGHLEDQIDLTSVKEVLPRLGIHVQETGMLHLDEEAENPCIAIVGQTKSGKSTFINVLLRSKIVTQSARRCTARLTHLTYSESNFVNLVAPDGRVLEHTPLNKPVIPSDLLNLSTEYRRNPDYINVTVRAGINSPFLQNGINIIDSPGLNENAKLEELSRNMMTSLLPMIIYIIDGRRSVTESDIENISQIKESAPHLRIVFFVTKLDIEKQALLQSYGTEFSLEEYANMKLDIAFTKLKKNGFFPEDMKREDCKEFHGASLWCVDDFHRNKTSDKSNMHVVNFKRFENCLFELLRRHLEGNVLEAAMTLSYFHESVLEKVINRARKLDQQIENKLSDIDKVRLAEQRFYEDALQKLTDTNKQVQEGLIEIMETKEERLLQPLETLRYRTKINIPPGNCLVTDSDIVNACTKAIYRSVAIALDSEISSMLESKLDYKWKEVEDWVVAKIMHVYGQSTGKTPYKKVLQNQLYASYDLENPSIRTLSRRSMLSVTSFSLLEIYQKFVGFMQMFVDFMTVLPDTTGVDVRDLAWKRSVAMARLKGINKSHFAQSICDMLLEDIKEKHRKWVKQIDKEISDARRSVIIPETIHQQLIDMAPMFAEQYTLCLDLCGRYQLNGLVQEKVMFTEKTVCVNRCRIGQQQFIMKTVHVARNNLSNISMEIYFSSVFQHPHLVPLIGVKLEDDETSEFVKISILRPYKKSNITAYLRDHQPSSQEKLDLCIQITSVVKYLHDQGLCHRTLQPSTVWVEDGRAFISDLGHCTSSALHTRKLVPIPGEPIFEAPEYRSAFSKDNGLPGDIFSLGCLFWTVFCHLGEKPDSGSCGAVWPERINGLPDPLWDLMSKCWYNDPGRRPLIGDVLDELKTISF